MRQCYTLTKGSVEHGFVFIHVDLNVDRLKSNFVCSHTATLSSGVLAGPQKIKTKATCSFPCNPSRVLAGAREMSAISSFLPRSARGRCPHGYPARLYLMVKPLRYSAIYASRCSGVIWLSNTLGLWNSMPLRWSNVHISLSSKITCG